MYLSNIGNYYWILISRVQTCQLNISIYKRSSFVDHHWGYLKLLVFYSNYDWQYYPFCRLRLLVEKFILQYSPLLPGCHLSFFHHYKLTFLRKCMSGLWIAMFSFSPIVVLLLFFNWHYISRNFLNVQNFWFSLLITIAFITQGYLLYTLKF